MATPKEDGFRMPPEWAPHERCWMAWPCRKELWGERMDAVVDAYAEVAKAIARFEPVTMIANPESVAEVSLKCGPGVTCLPMAHDDSWLRDSGATFLLDDQGRLAGVDWIFNAWGERYQPYDRDAEVAKLILEKLDVPRYEAPLVAEGGAIHVDGEGTLLAVEPTLVNDNRNPGKDRDAIEAILLAYTGMEKVIWLPYGLENDETDGHVDNVACFIRPGTVVAMTTEDREDANYERLQTNLEILRNATDAAGRALEVVTLPQPKRRRDDNGERMSLSYVNFYLANGGVIIPGFDDSADDTVYEAMVELFPDRTVVQVPVLDILHGGGGIHCITQQQPSRTSE